MKKPVAFKIAIVPGIILLGLAVALFIINPGAKNNLPEGFHTPILALEFAQTPETVQHLFSVKDAGAYKQAFLLGNWVDYGFMLVYSSFLFFVTLGIYRISRSGALILAFILCLLMLLGDALENVQLFNILLQDKNGNIVPYLHWLHLFTWIKWGSIAATLILLCPFFFSGTLFQKAIGFLQLTCFGLAIAAFLLPGILSELFALSVSVNFLLLFVFILGYKQPSSY